MRMNPTYYPEEVQEGRNAFFGFQSEFDNPYPHTDPKREAWRFGWEHAQEQST